LISFLLYQVSGLLPVLITQLFIFFYPHLIIYLGYDALGEIYGLAYMLLAFILFNLGLEARKLRWLWFLGCGLAAGLTIASKLVGLLALSGLIVICVLSYREKQLSLKEVSALIVGWIGPYLLWELYQFLTLTLLFDLQTYQSFKMQFWQFFIRGGSGVNEESPRDLGFIWKKLLLVQEISSSSQLMSVVVFLLILLSGPILLRQFYKDTMRRNIVIFLWSGWFVTSLWFIPLSQNGWVRHYWYALMFSVFLLSLLTTHFWQYFNRPPRWIHRISVLLITGLLFIGFISQVNAPDFFTARRLVERWHYQHLAESDTARIPWIIIPRAEQNEALALIRQLPASAHLYYPQGYKAAEIPPLTGRMTYPLERRVYIGPTENDVIVITPGLISPWAKFFDKPMTNDEQKIIVDSIRQEIKQECPQVILENDYYMICALE